MTNSKLMETSVNIIIRFKDTKTKHLYLESLIKLSSFETFFNSISNISEAMDSWFDFCKKLFKKALSNKDTVYSMIYFIKYFLRFLSNIALYGKGNKNIWIWLTQNDLEDFLYSLLEYLSTKDSELITELLTTYANLFQCETIVKFYNYENIIESIHHNYKFICGKS